MDIHRNDNGIPDYLWLVGRDKGISTFVFLQLHMRLFVNFHKLGEDLGDRLEVEFGVELETAVVGEFALATCNDEEPQHLLAHYHDFWRTTILHVQSRDVFDHFSHPIPQKIENMQELNPVLSWREWKGEILFFDIICIHDLLVDMLDSLHEADL